MNWKVLWVAFAVLVPPSLLCAQDESIHICVVQVTNGFAGTDTTQEKGLDAIGLASSLMNLKTKNGQSIDATLIRQMPRAEVDDEVDKQQCNYVVELWRHINADDADAGSQGGPAVPQSGDHDAVEYQLRRPGMRKVLASGSAPIVTYYRTAPGYSRGSPSPYPILAAAIIKKIDR
jgi:hypothetical protein